MLLQRSQFLIQFVRTYCLNDVQAQIISAICRNFDFVDEVSLASAATGSYENLCNVVGYTDVRSPFTALPRRQDDMSKDMGLSCRRC